MTRGPRGKKHLYFGILLVLLGLSIAYWGLSSGRNTGGEGPVLIPNSGDAMEGYTPRGYSDAGKGLLVGDNVNADFPQTDGVRSFLTFSLEGLKDKKLRSVVLFSDHVQVFGTPFQDLGKLRLVETRYDAFSSKTWNAETGDVVCTFEELTDDTLSCDVTEHIRQLIREGRNTAQFILEFEKKSDGDKAPDILLFSRTGDKENKPGTFVLRVNAKEDQGPLPSPDEVITLPVTLHRAVGDDASSTIKTQEEIEGLFDEVAATWKNVNIAFDVTFEDTDIPEDVSGQIAQGNFQSLYKLTVNDPLSLHIYFLGSTPDEKEGLVVPSLLVVLFDTSFPGEDAAFLSRGLAGLLLEKGAPEPPDTDLFAPENVSSMREYAQEFSDEVESR